MTVVREKLPGDAFVDDEGNVMPYANVADDLDARPVSDASIAQGITNLDTWRREQTMVEEAEASIAKENRMRALADDALKNAGVYVTFEENRQTQRDMIEVAATIAQYEGGEKGGYQTDNFKDRYKGKSAIVEAGARANHSKLVNHTIPRLYKADELIAAGFSKEDVFDDINQMRGELKSKYGRGKEDARAKARAELG